MNIVQGLCCLALQQVVGGACKALGIGEGKVGDITPFLVRHFTDHSQKLEQALSTANKQAWKALEIALAGDSVWDRCKKLFASADQVGFAHQVRAFLDGNPMREMAGTSPETRQAYLRELQKAQKEGLLQVQHLAPNELARQVGSFARFADPQDRVRNELGLIADLATMLRTRGYPRLGELLDLQVHQGTSLLVVAVRYFFRRAVESDPQLSQGLAWATWQSMADAQQKGFACLTAALVQNSQRLEELLAETHRAVLDILAEVRGQKEQIGEIGRGVLELLAQHKLDNREVRQQDSFSIHNAAEREQIKRLLTWYRSMPGEQQGKLPAMLNGLGKLMHATGDFTAAQQLFAEVARVTDDVRGKAEACHNAYLAALDRRQWEEALASFKQAVALDPLRFQPFRLDKYEPEKILGAGGFGVAFLCRHRISGGLRVIKTLRVDGLGQGVADQVIREAKAMEGVKHDAIITLYDCEYADTGKTRLYLAMEYFEGATLGDYVKEHGSMEPKEVLELSRLVADGLREAHQRGILHRDIKPANLLVRREAQGWRVKVIDFGLALRDNTQQAAIGTPAPQSAATIASDIAGTVDYAAPEQLGRLPGVAVGRSSDIYGFGKTCCYALFRTPHPLGRHWRTLPKNLIKWLDSCIEEDPKDRPADFSAVLDGMSTIRIRAIKEKDEPQVAPSLVAVRGAKINAEYPIQEGDNDLGREGSDIDLSEQEVTDRIFISQSHGRIYLEKGKLFLEDCNSTNGTFLNRSRLQPGQRFPLNKEDKIQIGGVVLSVKM